MELSHFYDYERELPRDLFNEANLLKGWGRLSLLVHDGKAPEHLRIRHAQSDAIGQNGFVIRQDQSDGSISVINLQLSYGDYRILVSSPLNSRQRYTLEFSIAVLEEEYLGSVLTEEGELSEEFLEVLKICEEVQDAKS